MNLKKSIEIGFKILRAIPNFPLWIILGVYTVYNIYKNSNIIELEIARDKGELLTDEIKNHLIELYPKWLSNSIALIFYLSLIKYLL